MTLRRLLMTVDAVGGVWTYALDLARGYRDHGVETVLAVLGPPPSTAQADAAAGIALVQAGVQPEWLADSAAEVHEGGRRLAALAADVGADLVQLNHPALAAGGAFDLPLAAVAHSCVLTWWQAVKHGPIDLALGWRADLTDAGLRAADLVVAPSAAFAAAVQAAYRLPGRPQVVHNGRAPMTLSPAPQKNVAFTAGRLWDAGKNLAVLDAAAARLPVPVRAAGPVAGPNGDAVALRNLELLGNLPEPALAAEFAARPIFVSAALYEPFGLAVLEAAQARCARVLSDIPTFRELWDGAACFVPPDDAEGFARAIVALLADPERRAVLGAAAQERSARYSVRAMTQGMLDLYDALRSPSPLAGASGRSVPRTDLNRPGDGSPDAGGARSRSEWEGEGSSSRVAA